MSPTTVIPIVLLLATISDAETIFFDVYQGKES